MKQLFHIFRTFFQGNAFFLSQCVRFQRKKKFLSFRLILFSFESIFSLRWSPTRISDPLVLCFVAKERHKCLTDTFRYIFFPPLPSFVFLFKVAAFPFLKTFFGLMLHLSRTSIFFFFFCRSPCRLLLECISTIYPSFNFFLIFLIF